VTSPEPGVERRAIRERERARGRRVPRLPILLIVVGAIVAAAVLGTGGADSGGDVADRPDADAGATAVPAAEIVEGRTSATWYCAAGSSDPEGFADETVVVANIGDEDADVLVTVERGDEGDPVRERYVVPAGSQERILVSDLVESVSPGVVVEAFGGTVVVDHLLRGADDVAGGPCATTASPTWYFAAGTTTADTGQFLELFNPFGDDAVVDVTLFTAAGTVPDQSLEGFVVPAHSKVRAEIHTALPREEILGLSVEARSGRLVAERTTVYIGNIKTPGLAVSLGAMAPATDWAIVEGRVGPDVSEAVVVLNPGDTTAEIEASFAVDGDTPVEPQVLSVPPRSVAALGLGEQLPVDEGHTVRIRSVNDRPVVVDQRWVFRGPSTALGVAGTDGITAGSGRWAFGYAAVTEGSADRIVIFNPAVFSEGETVRVSATVFADGTREELRAADLDAADLDVTDVPLEPGRRLTVKLGDVPDIEQAALEITATGPVMATLVSFPSGVAVTSGVPVR